MDVLSNIGLKASKRRSAVIKAFGQAKKHLTVDELYEKARLIDPKVGYTTVWRTLKLLTSLGLAMEQKFADGQSRYEFIEAEGHHDHMICLKCGRVDEFINPAIEDIQSKVAFKHKFKMVSHKLEIYGSCEKCSVRVKK